jgi:hypothetical protein
MSSFRAEAFGGLSGFASLWQIANTTKTLEHCSKKDWSAYCDNKGYIFRSKKYQKNCIDAAGVLANDADIIIAAHHWHQHFPKTTFFHVLGHQDKKIPVEQLPIPAQLNVAADKLAGDYHASMSKPDERLLHLPGVSAQLLINNRVITTDPQKQMRHASLSQDFREYLDLEQLSYKADYLGASEKYLTPIHPYTGTPIHLYTSTLVHPYKHTPKV